MKKVIVTNKPIQLETKEKILVELINGRKPQNAAEEQLVAQIKEMEAKGQIPYIPSNL